MGSLLRSEEMSRVQLILHTDSAYSCVTELGELGLVQFIDINNEVSVYQRKFTLEVRRCDEMQRILRYIEDELQKNAMKIPEAPETPEVMPKNMTELEAILVRLEEELLSANENSSRLMKDFTELVQLREATTYVETILDEGLDAEARTQLLEAQQGQLGPVVHSLESEKDRALTMTSVDFNVDPKNYNDYNELRFIAGILKRSAAVSFERVLWRWCRGNVYVRNIDFPDVPEQCLEDTKSKVIFIVFFYGDELNNRVKKICDGFRATTYNCPPTTLERIELNAKLTERIAEMSSVIEKTAQYREKVLCAAAKNQTSWCMMVTKMKAVYNTLNSFNMDIGQRCLVAECWAPTNDLPLVRASLHKGMRLSESTIQVVVTEMETHQTPPTYNKINKFTCAYQKIIDSYGSATYREINPAPWTIITFPFIFAIMFGDAGHGLIMFLFALTLVLLEQRISAAKIDDEIFNTFFSGRYVILLMGLFSVYTGLVYNDIYSKSIDIFGSSWRNPYSGSELANRTSDYVYTLPSEYAFLHEQGPYPFGVDPIWGDAVNKLNYENPLKMKLSVIIGISQMTFGLMLSLFNHIYFKSTVDILFVWIPQLLFLSCIFIYLCIQIIVKWTCYYVWPAWIFGYFYPSSNCAPSLLIGLINMFMLKSRDEGFVNMTSTCTAALDACTGPIRFCQHAVDTCQPLANCALQQWYPNQSLVEMVLLLVAVISIPVMLLVKPFVMRYRAAHGSIIVSSGHNGGDNEAFNFGDTLVYQAIHTIEFCLGCISHTASYLRLWALSLAHAELSEVLWTMVFKVAFTIGGWPGAVAQWAIFWAFALLTVAILLLMEGLSAFLHALRLHWVEFQSKFFGGTGYPFEPFSFEVILNPVL